MSRGGQRGATPVAHNVVNQTAAFPRGDGRRSHVPRERTPSLPARSSASSTRAALRPRGFFLVTMVVGCPADWLQLPASAAQNRRTVALGSVASGHAVAFRFTMAAPPAGLAPPRRSLVAVGRGDDGAGYGSPRRSPVIVLRAGRPWPGFYGTAVTNMIVPRRKRAASSQPALMQCHRRSGTKRRRPIRRRSMSSLSSTRHRRRNRRRRGG